MAFAAIKASSF